jgi:RNA polymerase I-specific transcription initiation factor RRN5
MQQVQLRERQYPCRTTNRPAQLAGCGTMDTDSSYEDPPSIDGGSGADDDVESSVPQGFDDISRKRCLDNTNENSAGESGEEQVEALQSHYNDQYLSLFNETCIDNVERAKSDLGTTRIGLTEWSNLEKERFFLALSKRSKADVRGIVASIGSKSELEVYEYLQLLEEEDRNLHLYAEEVKNVTCGGISAAAEISIECNTLLEQAADALATYQDKFDQAVGEQKHGDQWLVNEVQADIYDQVADQAEDNDSSDSSRSAVPQIPAGGLFRLSSWLSLTERVFMNSDPARNEKNVLINATEDDVPAITQAAVSNLYELAVHRLRKIMQTSIFCAESRIRSTAHSRYSARAVVRQQDVAAAIGILGFEENRSHFWLTLARRNQLNVVDDLRKKTKGRKTLLSHEDVERILCQTAGTRRGRRSSSSQASSLSSYEDSDCITDSGVSDGIRDEEVPPSAQSSQQSSFNEGYQAEHSTLREDTQAAPWETKHGNGNAGSSQASSDEEELSTIEDDQDRHLEILDKINSQQQELELYRDLGWGMPPDIQFRYFEDVEAQEEVQRNSRSDFLNWRDSIPRFVESWEEHGPTLQEALFDGDGRDAKRRKLEQDTGNH